MSYYNRNYVSVSDEAYQIQEEAKKFREQLSGQTEDFINGIADTLIDRLIDKEPEVSELISSLIYKKLKALDMDAAIKYSVNKFMEEEFEQNILGVLNMRVSKMDQEIKDLREENRNVFCDIEEMRRRKYVTQSDYGDNYEVRFTQSCTLADIISRLDYLQTQIYDLKVEVDNERRERENKQKSKTAELDDISTRDECDNYSNNKQ